MIELDYSLVIEATEEPDYFGFYSEDCLYKAKWGMKEHVTLLKERGLPVPPKNPNPKIVIQNAQERQLLKVPTETPYGVLRVFIHTATVLKSFQTSCS